MEIFILAILIVFGVYTLKSRYQRRRMTLLGSHLGKYQIEKLMESLTAGYLRALEENDPERRDQIWSQMGTVETNLCDQFNAFVAEFSRVEEANTRMSRFASSIPYADRLFPNATFDLRKVLVIHAQGITDAAKNHLNRSPKSKAFTLSAELFLMQHTCHWFCRSKPVASARMLVRHKTSYALLLQSVAPDTARAYYDVVGRN